MRYHKSVFGILTYCLVMNDKQARSVRDKYNIDSCAITNDESSDAYAYYEPSAKLVVVRMMNVQLSLSEVIGLIVHEANHVKQFIMEAISEHNPSDEFESYTVQEITRNLTQDYFKSKGIKDRLIK